VKKKSAKSMKEHAMEEEISLLRKTNALLNEKLKAEMELREAGKAPRETMNFEWREAGKSVNACAEASRADNINHPFHYTQHPSGIECIQITEHFNFNRGNAVKYIWRSDEKGSTLEDLRKAQWYLTREIERLEKEAVK